MKKIQIIPILWILMGAAALGQTPKKDPHIGYIYPSGGQQGTVFTVFIGGQNLKGADKVLVSGRGVGARIVRNMGKTRRLQKEQRQELARRLKIQWGKLTGEEVAPTEPFDVEMPKHPVLDEMDSLSLMEVEFIRNEFLRRNNKKQINVQISETVVVEVKIDPKAPPGDRELRLKSDMGLTNPLCFQVGVLPEVSEEFPYDEGAAPTACADLPVLFNGQIKPGDVDRFQFQGRKGQKIVIETAARHLIPFLADAVPGWFQATLALYDETGKEVAFADDFHYNPDPVLLFKIPKSGIYELEIRDSIYRGRDDFVYRIAVGEKPFIKSLFPLGGQAENKTSVAVKGWNLGKKRIRLDTDPGEDKVRETLVKKKTMVSNTAAYAVDFLPECKESEPNDSFKTAQKIKWPMIINGRIKTPGDEDLFQIIAQARSEIVVEACARRLNSPMDSMIRLIDESGRVLAWNDDHQQKEGYLHKDMGHLTHHADSYLHYKIPKDGIYFVLVADSQKHGGDEYGYRLRISPPQPDFSLLLTPSTINMRSGMTLPVYVYALRKDGYDGAIEIFLEDPPPGFVLRGNRIPEGRDRVTMTLTAPLKPEAELFSLDFQGSAAINGQEILRPVTPSDNMMQAFLYRHLAPSKELMVSILKSRIPTRTVPKLLSETPIRMDANNETWVQFKISRRAKIKDLQLQVKEPVQGIALQDVSLRRGVLEFLLKADPQMDGVHNVIVEIFYEKMLRSRGKSKANKKISLGVLPAIPVSMGME